MIFICRAVGVLSKIYDPLYKAAMHQMQICSLCNTDCVLFVFVCTMYMIRSQIELFVLQQFFTIHKLQNWSIKFHPVTFHKSARFALQLCELIFIPMKKYNFFDFHSPYPRICHQVLWQLNPLSYIGSRPDWQKSTIKFIVAPFTDTCFLSVLLCLVIFLLDLLMRNSR